MGLSAVTDLVGCIRGRRTRPERASTPAALGGIAETDRLADFRERGAWALRSMLGKIAFGPPAFLTCLALSVVNVFKPVRIVSLNGKGRISIMISYLEPYLRGLTRQGDPRPWVVALNPGASPNEQITKMYARCVWLVDNRRLWLRRLLSHTYEIASLLRSPIAPPLGGARILKGNAREWSAAPPALRFTPEEEENGRGLLQEIGVRAGASYVCFGLREAAYYRQFLDLETRLRRVNSEAEADTYIRNPPLKNYFPMATRLAAQGLFVLRMGQVVGERLPLELPAGVVDYATSHRSEFGDIFLAATCKFLVTGGAGGLWLIASAFNRPVVMTDSYWIEVKPLRSGDLFIPKKLWAVADKRFLTFREMLAAGMRYSYKSNCRRDAVELVHNTSEEIAAVVDEMNRRLDGEWRASDEDEELQCRFQALYRPEHYGYGLPGRIGASFLREHKDLLAT